MGGRTVLLATLLPNFYILMWHGQKSTYGKERVDPEGERAQGPTRLHRSGGDCCFLSNLKEPKLLRREPKTAQMRKEHLYFPCK